MHVISLLLLFYHLFVVCIESDPILGEKKIVCNSLA